MHFYGFFLVCMKTRKFVERAPRTNCYNSRGVSVELVTNDGSFKVNKEFKILDDYQHDSL